MEIKEIESWIMKNVPVTLDEICYWCEISRARAKKIIMKIKDEKDTLYIQRNIMVRENYRPDPGYQSDTEKLIEIEKLEKELEEIDKQLIEHYKDYIEIKKEEVSLYSSANRDLKSLLCECHQNET